MQNNEEMVQFGETISYVKYSPILYEIISKQLEKVCKSRNNSTNMHITYANCHTYHTTEWNVIKGDCNQR